ncbi:MAG: aldo/keto reductase [Alphaproteobacteria bacterium]|nr:aldo/keto reductase [Alphaproteobacteria bacterium]
MKTRKLGALEVSEIGLGCMGMSFGYGEPDDGESIATMHRALELDVVLFNTSNEYAGGQNEELIAKALTGRRDAALINTKFGLFTDTDGSKGVRGDPEFVRSACEASLKRLNTDYIDLYSIHRVDVATPIEDTIGEMSRLVEEGKVRAIGISEAGADTLRRAHATHPITALETEYSLWTRDAAEEFLPVCRELGIGFIAYSPLGRGFLTGTIRAATDLDESDRRHNFPRFAAENIAENISLVETLQDVASELDCKPAQVALAWVMSRGDDVVAIPGTKRRTYLEENVAAGDITLTADIFARLDQAFPAGVAAGERHNERMLGQMGR